MKTLYKIGMLAVAALAFAGCSKEVDNTADQKAGTHTLTFTVQKDIDTKTAVEEGDGVASYVWTEKDDQYFHIYENGVEATEITMDLSDGNKIATFKATFNNTGATEFSYTAVYGSEISDAGNPLIINEQSPNLNSFDPAADVLVSAKPITFEGNVAADEDTEFQFSLKRVASVNKMTLKGLTAGEKVTTVELASDKNFSARYMVDKDSYTGSQKKLVLDYSELEDAVVGTDGTFPVYFVSAPVEDATFSVRVVTESTLYNRDDFSSKLTLAVGTFRRFGINLSEYGTPIQAATVYKLVEEDEKILNGAEYLIVGKGQNKAAGSYYVNGSTKYLLSENITVSEKEVSISAEAVQVFTLEDGPVAGQFYIKDSDGKYLAWISGNSVEQSEDKYLWTVTKDGIVSVGDSSRKLKYNSSSPRFACYTSAQTDIELYVNEATLVELADPELSFEGEATIDVDWADIEDFTAPTLNNPHNVTVTYSSSEPDVATVDATTGELEFVGNGTTVITATSVKTNEYKAGSAQYTLNVTGAPVEYDFTTVAELNAKVTTTSGTYNGFLTDAVVSFVPSLDTRVAIVKDATGSVMFYKSGHTLKEGQTYTGEIEVTAIKYNGLYSEVTAWDATFTGAETTVAPEIVTLSNLIGHYDEYQNAYVVVKYLTVTNVDNKNIDVTDGTNTYVVYYNPGTPSVGAGDNITVFGTVTKYGETEEIKVWAASDLTINSIAPKAITFTQPTGAAADAGCSFTVSVDNSNITSGTTVASGTTVTLTATAGTGYNFSGWTVNGAEVADASSATTTFTMGRSAVTVSASFTIEGGVTPQEVTLQYSGGTTTNMTGNNDAATVGLDATKWSVVGEKGSNSNLPGLNKAGDVRVYNGNTITVTALESGVTINSITITYTGTSYNKGKVWVNDNEVSVSGGSYPINASSFAITNGNSDNTQVRISSIVINYTPASNN